jgi:hypothetical protein
MGALFDCCCRGDYRLEIFEPNYRLQFAFILNVHELIELPGNK